MRWRATSSSAPVSGAGRVPLSVPEPETGMNRQLKEPSDLSTSLSQPWVSENRAAM